MMSILSDRIEKLDKEYDEDRGNWYFTEVSRLAIREILSEATKEERTSLARDLGIFSFVGEPIPYLSPNGWEYAVVDRFGDLTLVNIPYHIHSRTSQSHQQVNLFHTTYHHITLGMRSLKEGFEYAVVEMKKRFWEEADIPLALSLGIFGGPHPTFTRMVGKCPACGKDLIIDSVDKAVNVLCLKNTPLDRLHNWDVVCTPKYTNEKQRKNKPTTPKKETINLKPETSSCELYIQELYAPFFKCLKVGISNDTKTRLKQQQKMGMFKHKVLRVFKFRTRVEAALAEKKIKDTFQRSICLPEWLPDGHTETFTVEDYQKIVDSCTSAEGLLE